MIYFIGPERTIPSEVYKMATMDDVVNYCKDKKYLGVDTETEGMDFLKKKMIMLQIGDDDNQFVIDTRHVNIEPLRDILESNSITKILHNVKFDYKFIKRWSNITMNGCWDTMLVDQVIHCGKFTVRYSLKELCKRYLQVDLDKDVRNQFVGLEGQPFKDDQIVYGAKDVEYLCFIRNAQEQLLLKHKLEAVAELENSASLALADIEFNGFKLDKNQWSDIAEDSRDEMIQYEDTLDQMVMLDPRLSGFVNPHVQTQLFTAIEDIRKVMVKWSSPTQVLRVFQGLIPKLENVNGKELIKYRTYGLIDNYIKYKEKAKLATSYGIDFLKNVRQDNKIHTSFNQVLNTGRIASNSPNMQQIPADNRFRHCFIPDEDQVLVSADYSSQELCIIATGSKDPVWLNILEEGGDLHSECADLVFQEKWREADKKEKKKLRTNVKTINFGLAYGMGPYKLANTLQISTDEAQILIDKYFSVFPSIKQFLSSLGNYGKRYGHIKTFAPFRRIRWFEDWFPGMGFSSGDMKVLGAIERASKNTPIQGTGADMTKLALALLRQRIQQDNLPVKLVMTVHDQIDTMCPKDFAQEWSEILKERMEAAAERILGNTLLKADPSINTKWEK
jgi:DNA polymerase-1